MSDFKKLHLDPAAPRTELHDALGLTGAEVSVNVLPAGASAPFVHNHTANEEVYGIVSGKGELYLDGKVSEVTAGDWFVITPEGRRALRAAPDSAMTYVCIQTAAGSLKGFTMTDGKLCEEKAPWMA